MENLVQFRLFTKIKLNFALNQNRPALSERIYFSLLNYNQFADCNFAI